MNHTSHTTISTFYHHDDYGILKASVNNSVKFEANDPSYSYISGQCPACLAEGIVEQNNLRYYPESGIISCLRFKGDSSDPAKAHRAQARVVVAERITQAEFHDIQQKEEELRQERIETALQHERMQSDLAQLNNERQALESERADFFASQVERKSDCERRKEITEWAMEHERIQVARAEIAKERAGLIAHDAAFKAAGAHVAACRADLEKWPACRADMDKNTELRVLLNDLINEHKELLDRIGIGRPHEERMANMIQFPQRK